MLNLEKRGFWDPQTQMVLTHRFVGPDSFFDSFVGPFVSMGDDLWVVLWAGVRLWAMISGSL